MANGKFSKPRPYRDEEREIEHAFRQITGQEQPREPQPRIDPEDLEAAPAGLMPEELLREEPGETLFPEIPLEPEEEEAPDEPDFIDKLQFYGRKAVEFCGKNPKIVMVGLCAVALVMILGVMAAFFFGGSDPYGGRILNNVYIAGIDVGGLTKSEAVSAVKQATGNSYSRQDMVIDLAGTPLYLKPADTKVSLDIKAAVNAAFDYGRTGSREEREQIYRDSQTTDHFIGLLPYLELDQTYIRQVLTQYAQDTGSTLTQTNYGLEGDQPELRADKFDEKAPCQTLVINMGTPGVGFDPEAVFRQVLDAYSLHLFRVEVKDIESEAEPDPIDLEEIYEELYIAPIDASIDMQTFEAIPGSYGYGFDLEEAQKLLDKAEYGQQIRIPMEYIEPEILDKEMFYRDVLGGFETRISGSSRLSNIETACETLDGTLLNPGEEFSFNKVLGQPTSGKGYKKAPSYTGTKTVDTLGGGISQLSSTLYYCTLLADLSVTDRTGHALAPGYIDYGMDAIATWGEKDFKFVNTTNYPIRIEASVSGSDLKVQILGTDEKDYYIKMEYSISETTKPKTEYEDFDFDNDEGYEDGDVIQEGRNGYYIKTYKLKYDKDTDELLTKDFETSTRYAAVNKVVARVEPEETTEEETEPPATKPPVTEPPTEAPTEPPETVPTETPTEAPTEAPTVPMTEAPTEPPAEYESEPLEEPEAA